MKIINQQKKIKNSQQDDKDEDKDFGKLTCPQTIGLRTSYINALAETKGQNNPHLQKETEVRGNSKREKTLLCHVASTHPSIHPEQSLFS